MKIKAETLAAILVIIFLNSVLVGCGDAQEIDDEVYIFSLGIDKGVTNKVRVTIQYPTYKTSSGGGDSKKQEAGGKGGGANQSDGANIHTIEASTIIEALDMYGMAISRRVSMKHTKQLIFSEEFAREGIGQYIGPLARFRETRRIMNVIIVKGSAKDFIKEEKTNIGDSLAKAIELMQKQSDNTSYFPRAFFHDFYQGMVSIDHQTYASYAGINEFKLISDENKGDAPLKVNQGFSPGEVPREGVAKREYVGTALFDGDKMVGSLNSMETRYFLMVSGKFKRGTLILEDKKKPGDAIPLDIRLGRRPKIKGYFNKGKPVIDVIIEIEGDIGAIQSRLPYENTDMIKILNKQTEEVLKKGILETIKKTQELNADIFKFGHRFAGKFLTIHEWEKYNWLKHYKEAEVNVDVSVNIRRTGLIFHSSQIKGSK